MARQAVEKLFGIGQLFDSHERGQLAATVYQDIEQFSATVDRLGQADVGQPTTAARAALAAAVALHGDASRALSKRRERQTAALHMKLGNALEEAKSYAEAVQQWRMVLDLEPDHAQRTELLNLIKKHGHTLIAYD